MERRALLSLLGTVGGLAGCLRFQGASEPTSQPTTTSRATTDRTTLSTTGQPTPTGTSPAVTETTKSFPITLEQQWTDRGLVSAIWEREGAFFVNEFFRLARFTSGGDLTWESRRITEDTDRHFDTDLVVTDAVVGVGTSTTVDESDAGGELRGYSRDDGTVQWSVAAPADGNHHLMAHVESTADGTVIGVSQGHGQSDEQDPVIYAVDGATGERQWTSSELPRGFVHDIAVRNRQLLVGTSVEGLLIFDVDSGTQVATHDAVEVTFAGMAVDGSVVYTSDDPIQAFDLDGETRRWETVIVSTVKGGPSVGDGQVYYGTESGQLVAIDAASGEQQWTATTQAMIRMDPVVQGGVVWVADHAGTTYAFDAETGELAYRLDPWDDIERSRPIGAIDETVLVGGVPTKAFSVADSV